MPPGKPRLLPVPCSDWWSCAPCSVCALSFVHHNFLVKQFVLVDFPRAVARRVPAPGCCSMCFISARSTGSHPHGAFERGP